MNVGLLLGDAKKVGPLPRPPTPCIVLPGKGPAREAMVSSDAPFGLFCIPDAAGPPFGRSELSECGPWPFAVTPRLRLRLFLDSQVAAFFSHCCRFLGF